MGSRQAGRRVVTQTLPARSDAFTAFRLLRAAGREPFILETLGPPGTAIVGFDRCGSVEERGGELRLRLPPAARGGTQGHRADAFDCAERILSGLVRPAQESLPFAGGLVGFISYERAASQEGPDGKREPGVPDFWMGLYDRALVFPPGSPPLVAIDRAVRAVASDEAARAVREIDAILRAPAGDPHPPPAPAIGPARSLFSDSRKQDFERGVREVRRYIRAGDVYQANIAHRVRALGVDPVELYCGLRRANPSPFMGLIEGGGCTVVSGSPERLLLVEPQARSGRRGISTRPVAGTRPRGPGLEDERLERRLRTSPKERAEHVMLVDLERNDLGRVCEPGSVEVDEILAVERYSHVMHLVSNVRGTLREDAGLEAIARALLPGGTVTGCPKIRAMEIIDELESVPRGTYTGSMGYLGFDGRIDLNILIRSAFFPDGAGECHVHAGAGIVHDSRPGREWQETLDKAEALLGALGSGGRPGRAWMPPRRLASWSPPARSRRFDGARVLVIDNYDSFTYNLVQYVSATGARVVVVRNDAESVGSLLSRRPTHLIISPGPGTPADSGVSVEASRAFEGTPLLGVCLGLQAIVQGYGGRVGPAPAPVHGKSSVVRRAPPRDGRDILSSLPREFEAGRYHSLAAVRVKEPIEVTAVTRGGVVMAVRHREAPTFGVQFHPESVLTPEGMRIIESFLGLAPSAPAERAVARAPRRTSSRKHIK